MNRFFVTKPYTFNETSNLQQLGGKAAFPHRLLRRRTRRDRL